MKLTLLAFATFSLSLIARADSGTDFFEKKIRPALEKYCYRCHSDQENKIKGGLLVDSKHALLTGGDSGPAIVPGDLEKSELWSAINYEVSEMPPKEPMPDSVIADFKKWILMGAPDPRIKKSIQVQTTVTAKDIEKGRKFWAFQKPQYIKPFKPADPNWATTKIDAYIYQTLKIENLTPAPEAPANELVRRLYFDLIGLPPSPGEISRFEKAYKINAKNALTTTVDNLLASSHFGERWGRHWLDIARYAESTGHGRNMTYPQAWRYRDYVIDALNQDKPYDEFLQEQIAGDLLKVKTDEKWSENLIATSFLAIGPKSLLEDDNRKFQSDLIDEQIDVVTRGIMGISVSCARCHDHKFDPIPQADYYALAGIFQSSKVYYGTTKNTQNRHPSSLIRLPIKDSKPLHKPITKSEMEALKKQLEAANAEIREVRIKRRDSKNDSSIDAKTLQRDKARAENKINAIEEKIHSVDASGQPIAYCMGMQPSKLTNANILERGEVSRPGQEIPRGLVQVLSDKTIKLDPKSNGRVELAKWVSSKDNPLTARVMVNRIWLKLMGQALVKSPDNFGSTGKKPSNQPLLDYLALSFINKNWSTKQMIRSIVLSRTYRSSSQFNDDNFQEDPENEFFWRIEPRRLEAEVIRDAMLQVAGKINIQRPIASEVAKIGQGTQGRATTLQIDIANPHRSIYLPFMRDIAPKMLMTFDLPDGMSPVSQREVNNTSAQALFMLNNSFTIDMSDLLAKRLVKVESKVEKQITLAFQLCFARKASFNELLAAKQLYQKFYSSSDLKGKDSKTKATIALSGICQSLFSTAEFRYLN
jgi:hypothetical protein